MTEPITIPNMPPTSQTGLRAAAIVNSIRSCVHCGICLPACPTYRVLGEEMDSPRGRVYLMRAVAEGRLDVTETYTHHLDLCLGCRACETACPAGVPFGSLLETARADIEGHGARPLRRRLLEAFLFGVFPHPHRLAIVLGLLRRYRRWGIQALVRRSGLLRRFPRLAAMDALLQDVPRTDAALPEFLAARGRTLGRVALLTGCVAARTRDVTELLAEADLPLGSLPLTATYHDPCHLAHGQRVRSAPRALLGRIPDLRLVPLADSELCCGSAGVFNLLEPEMADRLLALKIARIAETGARTVVTGNPGCLMQIARGARERGLDLAVVHPVTLLARAVRWEDR